jgi:hypothetical protein
MKPLGLVRPYKATRRSQEEALTIRSRKIKSGKKGTSKHEKWKNKNKKTRVGEMSSGKTTSIHKT